MRTSKGYCDQVFKEVNQARVKSIRWIWKAEHQKSSYKEWFPLINGAKVKLLG